MFSNIIDLLNYYDVKKYFFIFNIFPLEFFENLTFKWVPLIGFWIKIICLFYFFILHLGEPQTTCICLIPKIDPP